MKSRQQGIIYQLATSETPLTAEEIAKRLAVSSRTIKTEMQDLREELNKIGAELVAKRNEGYSLHITKQGLFQPFFEQLSLKSSLINNFASDDTARFLYISRKLVSSSRYVKIDDIADELYTSRSTLRDSIKDAMEFLSSYRLITESKPGLGIRTFGMEHHARMAMMELFAIHFHKAQLDNAGMEYAKWVACDKKERQDIRHNFLRTLFASRITIPDLYTQRLSIYFIIARNRYQAGYRLRLLDEWIDKIKQFKEYSVAKEIYGNLSGEFSGYDLPEQEIAFVAIWLLSNRDMGHVKADGKKFPQFYGEALRYAEELLLQVKRELNVDLNQFDWVREELISMLIPILARVYFGLSGGETFDFRSENVVIESPLSLEIARIMAGYLKERTGEKKVELSIVNKFACLIYKVLSFTSYDLRKMKLLLVSMDGINFGAIIEQKLMSRFQKFIDSCTCVELYEVRGMEQKDYDAIIMNTMDFSYNYDLPHGTVHTIVREHELDRIYNTLLIYAHQYAHLLPETSGIHIFNEFEYISEEQFFQLIIYKHCRKEKNQKRMKELFLRNEKLMSYCNNEKSAILFGRAEYTDREVIELYCLKQTGYWAGKEISHILYVCLDWENNLQKVKAMENSLCQLSIHTEYYEQFKEDKDKIFEKLVYQSLKS